METIANLWLFWLIGALGSLAYFFWLARGFFAFLTQKDNGRKDPEDKTLTALTLRTFWPLILAGFFLLMLLLTGFYHIAMV